ncbi:tetratricopeptide repeat protein [methane-oxidizing endosymbiont of Gigantopelta aegis]|uniref:tetratricopeptide repeat protein n=1 Tax=methane-oxidizing endosymbiont of Gigantopelta aegis TaxID=2794938 RepID=UPI0018DDBDD0|nr:hypothetical protein [methane-oxidizing endosymbiont of Gigantopelta aegis]
MPNEIQSQAEKARQLVSQAQYKEAAECYRKLWLETDDIHWRQAMAECYLARAQMFAKRAMYREAVDLWRQYRQMNAADSVQLDDAVLWLLALGDQAEAKALLKQGSADQIDYLNPDLVMTLGLLQLTGTVDLRGCLPQDSQFVADLAVAEAALQALPDKQAAAQIVQDLSPDSAFYDFARLIQELPLPQDSPYAACLPVLQVLPLQGQRFVAAMTALNRRQREAVYALRRLSEQQCQFIERYCEQVDDITPLQAFDWVMQFRALTSFAEAMAFCAGHLPNDFVRWLRFKKQFPELSAFELSRLKALACERSNDFHGAEQHWLDAIDSLNKTPGQAMKIALILRHIAEFYPPESQAEWLAQSLRYDPDDVETQDKLATLEGQHTPFSLQTSGDDGDVFDVLLTGLDDDKKALLYEKRDELMMVFTPEQLAAAFESDMPSRDLEQALARQPMLYEGLLLLKAAECCHLPKPFSVQQLLNTVEEHD